jgi:hypothetical protein
MAKFAYYRRLDARRRRIYDQSDAAGAVRLPGARELAPQVEAVARGLARDDRAGTETAVQQLVGGILQRLRMPPVRVRVLAVRPSSHREELHGLYEFGGKRPRPVVTVWMRTAERRRVVAFRTFLRTLLHEVVHHLDYQMLQLADSFHTEGFYKRTEGLYRQLVPEELAVAGRAIASAGASGPASAGMAPAAPAAPGVAAGASADDRAGKRRKRPVEVEQPLLPFLT